MMGAGQRNARLRASPEGGTLPNDNEAIRRLLEEQQEGENEEEEDEDRSIDLKIRRQRASSDHSKWLQLLGVTFLVLLLLTVAAKSSWTLYESFSYFASQEIGLGAAKDIGSHDGMLGIRLHPEDHLSRPPTTITHVWNVTSGYRSPDGVKKKVYLVNDSFPGPTIECRSGDRLVVHLTNSLDSGEGISIHWHGLEMRNSNGMDGAVGFTQCPIPPSKTFTYDFVVGADQAGTFWWHAHSQVERGDGIYGGLVVHKPIGFRSEGKGKELEDEVLLLVGDWYHRSAEEVLTWYTSVRGFGNEPVPDSMLINGRGRFDCSLAPPARPVECIDIEEHQFPKVLTTDLMNPVTRLRLVNVGSLAGFTVEVSSAALTPLVVDGDFPIKGLPSQSVGIVYPGERVDLLLTWDRSSAETSQLHISLDPENFKYTNAALQPNQSFPIFSLSPDASAPSSQTSSAPTHFDLSTAVSHFSTSLQEATNEIILLYAKTQKLSISSNHPQGFMNRTSWIPQSRPLLSLPRPQWDKNQLIPYIRPGSWVDLVINNLDDGSHPFHLHGYSFYLLASHRSEHGWGSYNPYSTRGASAVKPVLNLENPVRKDTVSVPRRGYVVVRFKADNEGIWMLHCHVLFHQGSGMAMGVHVGGGEGHENVDLGAKELCDLDDLTTKHPPIL